VTLINPSMGFEFNVLFCKRIFSRAKNPLRAVCLLLLASMNRFSILAILFCIGKVFSAQRFSSIAVLTSAGDSASKRSLIVMFTVSGQAPCSGARRQGKGLDEVSTAIHGDVVAMNKLLTVRIRTVNSRNWGVNYKKQKPFQNIYFFIQCQKSKIRRTLYLIHCFALYAVDINHCRSHNSI